MVLTLNKEIANSRLRRSIKALKGELFRARPEIVLQHVLVDLEDLEASGFWWQARCLSWWLHRFQGGAFTRPEGRDPSKGGEGS